MMRAMLSCGVLLGFLIPLQPARGDEKPAAKSTTGSNAEKQVQRYPGFDGYQRQVTTASRDAQRWFNQGIQLLFGFNHDEAIRSFAKAAEVDPSCAMAWWGVAYARGLHINNPQMGEEQSQLAYEAAQKALAAIDNESPVEQQLIRAVAQRYALPVPQDRKPLDEAYADAMELVWHQFPQDADVGALYAESLMNLQPWDLWTEKGAPKGRTLEILGVLERTLAKTPDHPGANHFYIHAIEASPWPEKGVAAADRLGALVPGSGHLVHMPSHIFIRVGRYAEAADTNERAIAADESYFKLAPPPDFYSLYFMHNVHFLAYAAMMEGRLETALAAARKIERQIPADFLKNYVTIADGFTTTALHVLIRFGRWKEILEEPEAGPERIFSRAVRHYARSVAYSNLGRADEARRELQSLDQVAGELGEEWKMGNNPARTVIAISRDMAEAELAFREGQRDKAFQLLSRAAEQEDQLVYDEPPGWMQPVRHAWGALLLAANQPKQAEQVYSDDLERHPNNAWSLLGLRQALAEQGRDEAAKAMADRVAQAWQRADIVPSASCYCHPDARFQRATDAVP